MSVASKSITKFGSLCVQNWRSRSAFIRKLVLRNNLRPGASPPHASRQLGGLALSGHLSKIRNPKHEIRNKFEAPNPKPKRSQVFVPRILSLFRISDFGFRICSDFRSSEFRISSFGFVFFGCVCVCASVRRLSLIARRVSTSGEQKSSHRGFLSETTSMSSRSRTTSATRFAYCARRLAPCAAPYCAR
jgi:hypothetical protein